MESNNIKKNFIQLILKKGKKEKIEKFYSELVTQIKVQQQTNPQVFIIDRVQNFLPKIELKPVSKRNFIIKTKPPEKQLNLALRWLKTKKN